MTRQRSFIDEAASAVRVTLEFFLSMLGWIAVRVETLPERFDTWLDEHNLNRTQFAHNVILTLVMFAVFGTLLQLWGVFMGAAIPNPQVFLAIAGVGFLIFGTIWVLGIYHCLMPISWLAGWIVLGVSALGTLVLLGGSALEGWLTSGATDTATITRGFIVFGFAVSMICLIPFLVAKKLGQIAYALIFRSTETMADILRRLEVSEAEVVKQAMADLRKLVAPAGMSAIEKWFGGLSIFTVVLFHFPTPAGLLGALAVAAGTGALILGIRKPFGIKGYLIPKVLYTSGLSYIAGVLIYIGLHTLFTKAIATHPGWLHTVEFWASAAFTLILFLVMLPISRMVAEEEELREGKAPIKPFRLIATGVDPATGKPILGLEPKRSGATDSVDSSKTPSGVGKAVRTTFGVILWIVIFAVILALGIGLWIFGVDITNWNGRPWTVTAFWALVLIGFAICVYQAIRGHKVSFVVLGIAILVFALLFGNQITMAGTARYTGPQVGWQPSPQPITGVAIIGPPEYVALVDKYLAQYPTVPRNLALALVQIESDWDPKAVSPHPRGAQGLMQLMPNTWSDCQKADATLTDIFDPEQNIRCGLKFLAEQLATFSSTELALAAYNWGPAHIKKYPGKPWADIAPDAPQETQDHVRKIIALAQGIRAPGQPEAQYAQRPPQPRTVSFKVVNQREDMIKLFCGPQGREKPIDRIPPNPKEIFGWTNADASLSCIARNSEETQELLRMYPLKNTTYVVN